MKAVTTLDSLFVSWSVILLMSINPIESIDPFRYADNIELVRSINCLNLSLFSDSKGASLKLHCWCSGPRVTWNPGSTDGPSNPYSSQSISQGKYNLQIFLIDHPITSPATSSAPPFPPPPYPHPPSPYKAHNAATKTPNSTQH